MNIGNLDPTLRGAMEDVVTDQAAREGILQKLSQVADWMRNRP